MTLIELARKLRPIIERAAQSLDDASALDAVTLFPEWKPGADYPQGQKLRYNGVLYNVLQAHTSQEAWMPDAASSLYAKVLVSEDGTPKEWEQPDSTNGYKTGDKVIFNGAIYESTIDHNVWSPEAYPAGWKLI